jgi:hypothetical protein
MVASYKKFDFIKGVGKRKEENLLPVNFSFFDMNIFLIN